MRARESRTGRSRKRGIIAIDLGGTKIAAGLFDTDGILRYRNAVPLEGRSGAAVGGLIKEQIAQLGEFALLKRLAVRRIGISVPGIVDGESGRVWAPNIPGWKNYPPGEEIRRSNRLCEVKIDSDRACSILGEVWQGAARGCQNAIFLAIGTGIGAGILVDGKVLRGENDIAGAVGWMALERPFRKEYVSCGCFEHHASGEGLGKIRNSKLETRNLGTRLTAQEIFAAYKKGDALAKAVLREAVQFWGMGVANLVSIFNPEKIIFGGGVFGPGKEFLREIRAEAKKWAQPIAMRRVKLEVSRLGPNAALYGAAFIAT